MTIGLALGLLLFMLLIIPLNVLINLQNQQAIWALIVLWMGYHYLAVFDVGQYLYILNLDHPLQRHVCIHALSLWSVFPQTSGTGPISTLTTWSTGGMFTFVNGVIFSKTWTSAMLVRLEIVIGCVKVFSTGTLILPDWDIFITPSSRLLWDLLAYFLMVGSIHPCVYAVHGPTFVLMLTVSTPPAGKVILWRGNTFQSYPSSYFVGTETDLWAVTNVWRTSPTTESFLLCWNRRGTKLSLRNTFVPTIMGILSEQLVSFATEIGVGKHLLVGSISPGNRASTIYSQCMALAVHQSLQWLERLWGNVWLNAINASCKKVSDSSDQSSASVS